MDRPDRIAARRMRALGLWEQRHNSPEDVVAHLTAMQAQEHPFARWSVAQRVAGGASASAVDRAFDEGDILRTHVLRPTWHYVARRDLRWLIAMSGPRVLARSARRSADLGLDARTLGARERRDRSTRSQAGSRRAATSRGFSSASGVSVDGQRLAYILMHAELTGAVCSGPMRDKQHTYASFDQRVATGTRPQR